MIRPFRDQQDAVGGIQRRVDREIERNIERAYRRGYREIRDRMADMWQRVGGEMTPGQARQYNRLGTMLDWIEERYGTVLRDVDRKTRLSVPVEYQQERLRRRWQIEQAVGVELDWPQIPERAVELAVNNPLSKLKESALLATDRRRRIYRVRQALTQSILQGKTFFQTSREIGQALNTGMYESLRVVRTEIGRIRGQAQVDAMKDANDVGVETRLRLMAALDDRTREQSARMDGQLSDEEGRFKYPDGKWYIKGQTGNPRWDINDRETTVPNIEDLAPTVRRARDVASGRNELVPNEPFTEWARRRGLEVNRYGERLFDPAARLPPAPPSPSWTPPQLFEDLYAKGVTKLDDVEEIVSRAASAHPEWFINSPFSSLAPTRRDTFMSTDTRGSISVGARKRWSRRATTPQQDLVSAMDKISKGQDLSFIEEYAVEALWHEILHNQVQTGNLATVAGNPLFEPFHQLAARRSYGRLLRTLGGTPRHMDAILESGLGYADYVKKLLGKLREAGVQVDDYTNAILQAIDSGLRYEDYYDRCVEIFSALSGRPHWQGHVTMKEIFL